jgi:hypothetical protein
MFKISLGRDRLFLCAQTTFLIGKMQSDKSQKNHENMDRSAQTTFLIGKMEKKLGCMQSDKSRSCWWCAWGLLLGRYLLGGGGWLPRIEIM